MVRKYNVESRRAKRRSRLEQRRWDRAHLLQVDESLQASGGPHQSVRLEMGESNRGWEVPWVTVVLFREDDFYEEINGEMCPPPDGYRLVVD